MSLSLEKLCPNKMTYYQFPMEIQTTYILGVVWLQNIVYFKQKGIWSGVKRWKLANSINLKKGTINSAHIL